jgi:long-chain fatty acid transport protein
MRKTQLLLALAAIGLAGSAFATNGYFSHGYGMKSKGMGGVGIAYGQDALAAATNPANMVLIGNRWDVGVDYFRPQREAEIVGNGAGANGVYDGNGRQDYLVPEFGYNQMIGSDMSFGVSVYGNGGMATSYKNNPFGAFGATGTAGVDLSQLFIAPTFAKKLNADHAVGVSLKLAYQRFRALGLSDPSLTFGFAGISSDAANLTNRDYDNSYGYGIGLGWTGQVTPTLTLGATYQSRTYMSEFDKYKGLFAEQGDFDIPESFGAGFAWKASPQLTVAADVQRINYSSVNSLANPLLFPPAGPADLLGADGGSGFGWRDMTVVKLGVSYDMSKDLTLRAGYSHGRQPIPSSQTIFNVLAPGVIEDHLTLGATWKLADTSEVSLAYMHAFEKSVNGVASIPAGFGGGNANIKMHQDSFGVAYGKKF